MLKSVQEYQEELKAMMGSPYCYKAANGLKVEGEDVMTDRSPWLRLKQHQLFYTKPGHRENQAKIKSFFPDNSKISERLSYCAFPDLPKTDSETESVYGVSGVRFCRVRTCPICQWRRSRMWQARAFKKLSLAIQGYPKARYGLLTLTVRNCQVSELKGSIQDLKSGYKRLRTRLPVKNFVLGSAWSIEVTRRYDGSAHHHMHVLIMGKASAACGRGYLSKAAWSNLWKECMNLDYEPIVHCKWFPKKSGEDELRQLVGTLRYMTKESKIPSDRDWFRSMAKQTHGVRSIGCTGLIGKYMEDPGSHDCVVFNDLLKL